MALLAEVKPHGFCSSSIAHAPLLCLGVVEGKVGLRWGGLSPPAFLEKKLFKPLGCRIVGSNVLETVGGPCVPALCVIGDPPPRSNGAVRLGLRAGHFFGL